MSNDAHCVTMKSVTSRRKRLERKETTIYLGNLHSDVDDELLFELALQAGPVANATVIQDFSTGKSKGYGFADFESVQAVNYACQLLDGLRLFGQPLRVKPSDHGGRSAPIMAPPQPARSGFGYAPSYTQAQAPLAPEASTPPLLPASQPHISQHGAWAHDVHAYAHDAVPDSYQRELQSRAYKHHGHHHQNGLHYAHSYLPDKQNQHNDYASSAVRYDQYRQHTDDHSSYHSGSRHQQSNMYQQAAAQSYRPPTTSDTLRRTGSVWTRGRR
eukprot:TRINITY_DN9007_c0_g1_i1.p1 TRINITY_DN9007_c0_g1~~TRINITY_DN9007_c0_g1_i1.p1  ORF type:complete len:280 (+),score=15.32 TRINITY_DN9007_c0_g1_i1:25-840(+)